MDFWLIKDGEKTGPIPDYEIRSRISMKELDADSRVWHEGLAEWTRLGELERFKNEFQATDQPVVPPDLPREYVERAKAAEEEAKEKPKRYIVRRFWARWTDLSVYSALWWLGMYYAGQDIGAVISNPWLLLPMYVPWFLIEAWMLQKIGTTPGKWLMGLRVVNDDDSLLTLRPAIWRSIRVMITGVGFGWPLLSILCQAMSLFTTRRLGKPIWDFLGKHKVVAKRQNPLKIIAMIVFFAAAVQLQMAVRGPHERDALLKEYPKMEKYFDGSEGWYLPVRK